MPIYDFSRQGEELIEEAFHPVLPEEKISPKKGQLFSQIAARLFFLLLLVADFFWMGYALISFVILSVLRLSIGRKTKKIQLWQERRWIALRRSVVCALALILALFSPSFGMMMACTYFLMYDKNGIHEVFPSSLQSQFKEFFPKSP